MRPRRRRQSLPPLPAGQRTAHARLPAAATRSARCPNRSRARPRQEGLNALRAARKRLLPVLDGKGPPSAQAVRSRMWRPGWAFRASRSTAVLAQAAHPGLGRGRGAVRCGAGLAGAVAQPFLAAQKTSTRGEEGFREGFRCPSLTPREWLRMFHGYASVTSRGVTGWRESMSSMKRSIRALTRSGWSICGPCPVAAMISARAPGITRGTRSS